MAPPKKKKYIYIIQDGRQNETNDLRIEAIR